MEFDHAPRIDADHVVVMPASGQLEHRMTCLLYTSDAADERSSVDLGGRRIIKKTKQQKKKKKKTLLHTTHVSHDDQYNAKKTT